jgi:quinolinate synthase
MGRKNVTMDLNSFMQKFAEEIGGDYSQYDATRSVIIVKLPDERFQTVLGKVVVHEKYNREVIEFTSKVCSVDEQIDYASLLRQSEEFIHSKFIVAPDNYLKVAAAAYTDNVTEDVLKEMILEAANVADEWENEITGLDVN